MSKLTCLILLFKLAASAQSSEDDIIARMNHAFDKRIAYSEAPFDVSATQLPPHFVGHDIEGLEAQFYWLNEAFDYGGCITCAALDKASNTETLKKYSKTEYETTAQFRQRIDILKLQPVTGSITPQSVLAFVTEDVNAQYDADTGVLSMKVPYVPYHTSFLGNGEEPKGRHVDIKGDRILIKTIESGSSGIESNAFGATVSVSHSTKEFYGVVWDNSDEKALKKAGIQYRLNVDAQTAQRLKPSVSALVICSLKPANFTINERGGGFAPTFHSPYGYTEKFSLLYTDLRAVWFFDSVSGNVYAKIEPDSRKK